MATEEQLQALARRAAGGDEAAFTRLAQHYEKLIFHLALGITGNREDAQDVAQETLIKLWHALPAFRFACSPTTFVTRIAHNAALDFCRSRQIRHTEPLDYTGSNGSAFAHEPPDDTPASNPALAFRQKERAALIRAAMAELEPAHREILILRDMEGLSYQEIGGALGLSEGTVKSRLNRARRNLKELLLRRNFF